jgi:chitin disaccharide deacetylase
VRRLIINADDFGLTPGINRAILELHRSSALTSATLMATSSCFSEAVSATTTEPRLGVGCHVVLVDGTPVLPAAEISSLLVQSSEEIIQFRPKLGGFVADLLRGRIRDSEIEAEATAQIRKAQRAGVKITHLDTHKHTHMFPRVLRPLLRAALSCGVKAIRNPFEPDWSLEATLRSGGLRKLQVKLLRSQRNTFLKEVAKAGLKTTDGAIGVLATGTLEASTINNFLAVIPNGTWEMVCHPGYDDSALRQVRTRLLQSREIERTALLETIPHANIELIHFGQLD